MALKNYSATSLIGGVAGALDSIDGTGLQDLDFAIVVTADTHYFYTLDDDSAAAESSPTVISPDDNAGTKRWVLVGSFNQALLTTSSPTLANLTVSTILTLANAGLHILDSNASHDLIIKPGSNLTADRILTITTGDAARTVTLSGNPTLSDWFDQAVKAASTPSFGALIFGAQATDPTLTANQGQLYTKDYDAGSGDLAELFWANESDDVCQITYANAAGTATSVLGIVTGTNMLFGNATSRIGWTKKTNWQDGAMIVISSDADGTALGSGGAIKPQTAHKHKWFDTSGDKSGDGTALEARDITGDSAGTEYWKMGDQADGLYTSTSDAYYYQEASWCTKD